MSDEFKGYTQTDIPIILSNPQDNPPGQVKHKSPYKPVFFFLICGVILIAAARFLVYYAAAYPDWIMERYIPFSIKISGILSNISAGFRFSLAELVIYMMLVCIIVALFTLIYRLIRRRLRLSHLVVTISAVFMAASAAMFIFLVLWGLNYYAPSMGEQLGLNAAPSSKEALIETTLWLRDKVNEYAPLVPRNTEDAADFGTFDEIAASSGGGFETLAEIMPRFSGAYNIPKQIFSWRLFSKSGIWGIYIPFTGEANVNPDVPDASMPFTMCHEMSHRLATAPEDETNFIAFLSCINNPDAIYKYSGYFSAFIYCINAAASVYPDAAADILSEVSPYVLADFRVLTEHNLENQGAVQDFASEVNNNYLRSMSQEDGVLSYGRVVDLIIAYYFSAVCQ